MRSTHKQSSEAPGSESKRVRSQPEPLVEQEPVHELQQSAGNQAMLQLLNSGVVQRKAKGAEAGAAESGPTPEAAPAKMLIVDNEAKEVGPGQMRKSEFLSQLRASVCSTAEEALQGTMWSAMGCPYIDKWLNHYAAQPSSHLERALRKYAPETASARSAQDYIPLVTRRVRRGIEEWSSTGEVKDLPEEFAEGGMPGATVSGLMGALMSGVGSAISGLVSGAGKALSSLGSILFKHREGAEPGSDADPEAIRGQLGSGQALDSSVRRRMQSAFGHDFAGVRVHTDAKARELSEGMNARAFTVGNDIAFGGEEYKPGTPVGDALIAHELAHVVQQGGSAHNGTQHKGGAAYGSLEEDADRSAVGAVAKLWMGARGELAEIGQNAMPRMRSGLRLQGCGGGPKKTEEPTKATKPVVLSGDWAKDVQQAKDTDDDSMRVELVKKALVPKFKVNVEKTAVDQVVDPADYDKAPVINFDLNLARKKKVESGGRVGANPGYSFDRGSDTYAIIGPNALKDDSPLVTVMYAEHELYHTTHHLGSHKKQKTKEERADERKLTKDEREKKHDIEEAGEEVETWTNDFVKYFHLLGFIGRGPKPDHNPMYFGSGWDPLVQYYQKADTGPKGAALKRLTDYYKDPPLGTGGVPKHPKSKDDIKAAFKLWLERRDQSAKLIVDLKAALKL